MEVTTSLNVGCVIPVTFRFMGTEYLFIQILYLYGYKISGFNLLISGFPGGSDGREFACNAGDLGAMQKTPWVGKTPWRREWQATLVFLPEEFHGQRILAGYSPWAHKELDKTERYLGKSNTFTFHFHLSVMCYIYIIYI